jgi:hypothetical protein
MKKILLLLFALPMLATAQEIDSAAYYKRKEGLQRTLPDVIRLTPHFNYEKDDFGGMGWWSHKNNTNSGIALSCQIRDDGYIYLESRYIGDDWIFHTHIKVNINDTIYTSAIVEETSDNNEGKVLSDASVLEQVSYVNGGDNGILNAIYSTSDTEIKIRFCGKKNYDYILTKENIQLIKDSYEWCGLRMFWYEPKK